MRLRREKPLGPIMDSEFHTSRMREKHLVVIGAGPAGYVAALRAAAMGCQVTLIEAKEIGGTCLHRGCIPTKTLVFSCALLDKFRHAQLFGLSLRGEVFPDWQALRQRIDNVVGTLAKGLNGLLADRKVRLVNGRAQLADNRRIKVEGHGEFCADFVLICTGSKPSRPAMFPFDGSLVATSDDVLKWETLPQSLVIVGEGVIACEFAFAFSTLGVEVTVVGLERRPLPMIDAEISVIVAREMRKRKIRFLGGNAVEGISIRHGRAEVMIQGGATVSADRALVCVGRVPNTQDLGAHEAGLTIGKRGEIVVDDLMRTNLSGVYAAGDVTGRTMLAHAASGQGKLAVNHMLGLPVTPLNESTIPWAIFTLPEIGCVGLSEEAARNRGIDIRCGRFDLRGLGRAQATGELTGMVKVVAESKTGQLLGVHMIGAHASELIHPAVIALQRGAQIEELFEAIYAHPTLSEAIPEAAEDVFGQATHKLLKLEGNVSHELSV